MGLWGNLDGRLVISDLYGFENLLHLVVLLDYLPLAQIDDYTAGDNQLYHKQDRFTWAVRG